MEKLVGMLRAAGDPTRLRLLLLLRQAELTVSELTEIVGQSQPRVSRHLKLLCDAGLLERFKEGSWVFYRAADTGKGAELSQLLSTLASADSDMSRLSAVREQRAAEAAAYFKSNAAEWERIRALHAPEKDVEAAISRLMAQTPMENLLDAGTGTGRMLELLAPQAKRAVGIDVSPEMLAIARDRLMRSGLTQCQVRLGDTYRLPFPDGGALTGFDAVLFHQVLHYLDDPGAAVAEAARVMRASGRLLIADFAAHDLEFLRTDFAHRRLGFSDRDVQGWFQAAGLKSVTSEAIAPHKGLEGKTDRENLVRAEICAVARGGGMSLRELVADDKPIKVSFEFSPPKTPEAEEQLWRAIRRLEPLSPAFVSVTYGAGGSTRERTHATVKRIVEETSLSPAAHLTCVSSPKSEIDEIVQGYWDAGVRHIVALRGDMPDMSGSYAPHAQGYATTPELIEGIRRIGDFDISVSCYPERHPDSPSRDHDLALLRKKIDAGATRAIAQFCFDSEVVARMRDRAAAQGIAVPIIPGMMPTTNFKGIQRMAQRCGARVPDWMARVYDGLDNDVESRRTIAAAVMAEQVAELHRLGFDQFHFYTLNQSDLTYAACRLLGLQAKEAS